MNLLVSHNALEIQVLHLRPEGVHVDRAQQNLLLFPIEVEAEDGGVESLLAQLVPDLLVLDFDGDGLILAAINHTGNKTRGAQTAARTRPLRRALTRDNFDLHDITPEYGWPATRHRR